MKKKIFADLPTHQVIQLERLLQAIFIDMDTISARKNILLNAGIDEYLIATMDFNSTVNEFTTNLVAKLKNYAVSTRKPDYHPLVALLKYLLYQPERFNLDDADIELCQQIISIEREDENRDNQTQTNPNPTSSTNNPTKNYSIQTGKNIVNIGEGKDIHIGAQIYYADDRNSVDKTATTKSTDNDDELSVFIQQLKYARLEGEEGDRQTGSFYTHKVWLEDISPQKSISDKNNQQYTITGKWYSEVYKEINLFGLRVDSPWGDKKKPDGEFLINIEVLDGEIKSKIKADRNDHSASNYAANKVEKLLERETSKLRLR